MPFMIAIDGPAGAGKSTVARRVAAALGLTYLDTGAMYRALTWKALRTGCELTDPEQLTRLAEKVTIRFSPLDANLLQQVWLNTETDTEASAETAPEVNTKIDPKIDIEEVTDVIRTPEISNQTSVISAFPTVRKIIVGLQRRMGESDARGVVLEGRDIGTVVFPQAPLKIFLTASPEERARRRWQELQAKGAQTDFTRILADQHARDKRDSERLDSPLTAAPDAVLLNTDALTIDQVVDAILALAHSKSP